MAPSDFSGLFEYARPGLDAALETAERLAHEWGLSIEGPMPGATNSLVLAAHQESPLPSGGEGAGGEGADSYDEFVLRMPLLEWESGTSGLLRLFAPHGGVAVLREDAASGAVLLPRLRPGVPLDTLPEDEATDAWVALVLRLREAEGDAPGVAEYLAPLWTKATDLRFDTDAPALARRLLETSPAPRLLHGDLHHLNVLRDGDAWVAIDPEGLSGDPAYECAAFLRNPVPALGREPDLPGLLERRIVRLAEGLGLPAARIWGWGFVRTALCVWEGSTAFEGAWLRVARALDVLGPRFLERLS